MAVDLPVPALTWSPRADPVARPPTQGQEPLKMSAFSAVLLAVGLPLVETNSTVSGRQSKPGSL